MKKILAAMTATAIIFAGCGGASGPKPSKKMITHKVTKHLPGIKLSFDKQDAEGKPFTKAQILYVLVKELKSKLRPMYKTSKESKNFFLEIYYTTNYKIHTAIQNNMLVTTFETGKYSITKTMGGSRRKSRDKSTTIKYFSKVEVTDAGKQWNITLDTPSSYETHAPGGLEFYGDPKDLIMDLSQTISKIQNISITRARTIELKGEVISKYSAQSTQSNFERNTQKQRGHYIIELGTESYFVDLEIFPYRTGSKVAYKLKRSYDASKVNGNRFKENLSKQMYKKISEIVNL